jgi:hypothetical protein
VTVAISATPHQEDYMSRADLARRISTVEHRMDSIEQRLDASFAALSTQIVQSNRETRDTFLATLRSEMATMGGSLRGDMEAMRVSLREEIYALHGLTVHRFEKLEKALADSVDETRRFMPSPSGLRRPRTQDVRRCAAPSRRRVARAR